MSWIFFVLAVLSLVGTINALWPQRRPWWLKLPSFNSGWFANELPLHALAGNVFTVGLFSVIGALDERPGQAAVVLIAGSSVGLLVLAAAHRQSGPAMARALHPLLAAEFSTTLDPKLETTISEPVPRSWLLVPWLAWFAAPGVDRVANVVYATVGDRDLKLDVYRPTSRSGNGPVLVEIHGGGWVTGDRRLEARPLMARLAAHGWVCISIDYRVGRHATWPDHITDVKTALVWVRDHIADYGGDSEFVAVTGGSSGGHLAALAALTPNDPEYRPQAGTEAHIRACVPFYGAYDFDNSLRLRAPAEMRFVERLVVRSRQADIPAVYEHASALNRVRPDAPPFFVIQGTSDNLVFPAESRAFVERLRRTSTSPVAYAEVPRGHHEFDAVPSVRTAAVIRGVERFLTHAYAAHRATIPTRRPV